MTHTIEGSWEEIEARKAEFVGHRLRVIIDPVEENEVDNDFGAPEHLMIRDKAHLEKLLLEGLRSQKSPLTAADWETIRAEIDARKQARKSASNA